MKKIRKVVFLLTIAILLIGSLTLFGAWSWGKKKADVKLKIAIDTHVTHVTFIANAYGGDLMADMNLRNVPEDLHRKAKAEAALEGLSLKALVIKALEEYLKKKKR